MKVAGIGILLSAIILLYGEAAHAWVKEVPRTREPITKEWCMLVYRDVHDLVGAPELANGGRDYNYKDVLECVQFGEWTGKIRYKGRSLASGEEGIEDEITYSPREWYGFAIGQKTQIKDRQEFLTILEKAKDAGTFEIPGYELDSGANFIDIYLANKYEGVELLKQIAKYQELSLIQQDGIDPDFLLKLFKEGKLSKEQLTAICIRMRFLIEKLLSFKMSYVSCQDVRAINDEQMAEAYGPNWKEIACKPESDFGFRYIGDKSTCDKNNEINPLAAVHQGVNDPYVGYDSQAPPDAKQKAEKVKNKREQAPEKEQVSAQSAHSLSLFGFSAILAFIAGVIVFLVFVVVRRKQVAGHGNR